MRKHDGGSGMWGIFLIFLGLTFLAVNTGLIDRQIWVYLVRFWPVLLILSGIHIILGNSLITKIVMMVLAVVVFGLILISGLKYYGAPIYFGWGLDQIPYVDWLNNYYLNWK